MKNLLFIPCYNCEKQIIRVLGSFDANVIKYFDEIIVINNRSTDSTEAVAMKFASEHPELPLTIIRNDNNYGLGGSHKVAFNYARINGFDYVTVLHGDDQGDIHNLLPLIESGEYKDYDCCLGARFMPGSELHGYSKFRTFGNVVYNIAFSVLSGKKIFDLGSGLNMYSTEMLKSRFYHRFPDNLTFNCYMILASAALKHKVLFFPVSWKETDQVSNVKMVRQAFNTILIPMEYAATSYNSFLKKERREKAYKKYTAKIIFSNRSRDL